MRYGFLLSLLLLTSIGAGCLQSQSKVYVCADGSQVSDPDFCQLVTGVRVNGNGVPAEPFDASLLDTSAIESSVLALVNEEREREGLERYRKNSPAAGIARKYSSEMMEGGFQHTDPEGKDIYDRLNENGVFYLIGGENLFFSGTLGNGTNEDYVSKRTVEGWLKSPGHRSLVLDRDSLFSDAGIGVRCVEEYCYVTMVAIGLKTKIETSYESDNCYLYKLYSHEFPYEYTVPMEINLDSPEDIDAWIINDEKMFDYCLAESPAVIESVRAYRNTKAIDEMINVEKGYMLLVRTFKSHDVSITLDYESGPFN
jgi:uncharacterized protein YkwD